MNFSPDSASDDSDPDEERRTIVAKYRRGRDDGAAIDPWEDPDFEVYHVTDRYGFIHNQNLPTIPVSALHKAQQLERERTQKWLSMTKKWDQHFPGDKMTRRVYKGIPEPVRGLVWSMLLDLPKIRKEQLGIYEHMRQSALRWSPDIRQIDLDVNRTYRNNLMFRKRYDVKQQSLFYVLAAYSMYNTEVGYCQGMSQIAALLLMYLDEEDAFWALSALMSHKRHSMHGFFIPGFPKLLRFQTHHDRILQKLLPRVKSHLDTMGIFVSLYTIKWFMQCFLDRVPFRLSLRLWDIYILEGEKFLVAMGYNLLKMHQKQILKMDTEELMAFFQTRLEKNYGFDDDHVIDSLVSCMTELRRLKLHLPPPAIDASEHPTKPFGLFVPPSVERAIGRKSLETEREIISGRWSLLRSSRLSISIPPDGGPEFVEGTDVDGPQMTVRDRLSLVTLHTEQHIEQVTSSSGGEFPVVIDQSKSAIRPTDLNFVSNRRAAFAKTRLDPIENDSPAEDVARKSVVNGSPTAAVVVEQRLNGDVGGKKAKAGKGKKAKATSGAVVGGSQASVYSNQVESSAPQQYGASVRL